MAEFKDRLKLIMEQRNYKPSDLSKITGIGKSSISQWMSGKYSAKQDKVYLIAQKLDINPSWLMGYDVNQKNTSNFDIYNSDDIVPVTKDNTVQIPLLGTIACGDPITAEQNVDSYITTLKSEVPSGNNFYLMCQGDSMYPTINDGSKVLIHEQPTVEDGEIAAVLIENESTLKRIKRIDGNKILLMPDNSKFEPILLDGKKDAKILGKAIKVVFDL